MMLASTTSQQQLRMAPRGGRGGAAAPAALQPQHNSCSRHAASKSSSSSQQRRLPQRVVCQASASARMEPTPTNSTTAQAALAVYAWPTASVPVKQQPPVSRSPARRWTTAMWFEAMVQTVVKQLDGAPFLLRVAVNPVLSLQLIRLQPADIAAGWEHIQQRYLSGAAAQRQDEAVILVHPVAAADRPCVVRVAGDEACPGCPHSVAEAHAAAAAAAAAYGGGVTASYAAAVGAAASATTTELLHGKFGECCDGQEHSHDHQHQHDHQQHSSSSVEQPPQQSQQQPDDSLSLTAFYGLVVQTRDASDPLQGCYLLKTVTQTCASSCNCTHYSLNQVCKGPSLQQQYQASWLV